MITSVIGKLFLEAYNEKFGTHYDAKTFFIEIFYPLFITCRKKMLKYGNTVFGNPKLKNKTKEELLHIFLEKINNGITDSSVSVDFPSLDPEIYASGQICYSLINIEKDDVYLSLIGQGLRIGVEDDLGNWLSVLFFKKNILLDIFEGWKYYRKLLNEIEELKEGQIDLWNARWLCHKYDLLDYDVDNPLYDLSIGKSRDCIDMISWTKVLIRIAQNIYDNTMMAYIYQVDTRGNTCAIIGFRQFNLNLILKPQQLYQKYFGIDNSRNAELLWGGGIGFKTACTQGVIGIKAMEPKGLKEYINNNKPPKAPKNEEEQININVYKIWILAMLNNEELWEKSLELAEMLKDASFDKDKSISTKRKNLVEQLLNATKKMQFIAMATEVIPFVNEKENFIEMVREINRMSDENVPYFLTLLRFQYKTI